MNRITSVADSQAILNKRQAEEQKAVTGADKNASFWDRQQQEFSEDPTQFNIYNSCIDKGHEQAFELQQAYRNFEHPTHAAAQATFKSHGYDFDKVRIDCMNSIVKKFGAKMFVARNTSYETAIMNCIKPAPGDADDHGMVRKAKAALQNKWHDRGYVSTKDDVALLNFFKDNHLSSAAACLARVSTVVENYFGDAKLLNLMNLKKSDSTAAQKMKQLRDDAKREEIRRKEKNDDPSDDEVIKRGKKGTYNSAGSVIAAKMNELRGIK